MIPDAVHTRSRRNGNFWWLKGDRPDLASQTRLRELRLLLRSIAGYTPLPAIKIDPQ
jgi:hypothetical protein